MAKSFSVGGDRVRRVTLDDTSLVIAVPVMGRDVPQVRAQWGLAAAAGADLVEWRADALDNPRLSRSGPEFREQYSLPVLYTVRRREEGGSFAGEGYGAAVLQGLGWADLVDVEWAAPDRKELVAGLQEAAVPVVASHHVLQGPVDPVRLRDLAADMAAGGASIAKIAWAANSESDVEQVLEAQRWAAAQLPVPAVLIAMGPLGASSRVGVPARLSAFTFAVGAQPSASGQLSVAEVLDADRQP